MSRCRTQTTQRAWCDAARILRRSPNSRIQTSMFGGSVLGRVGPRCVFAITVAARIILIAKLSPQLMRKVSGKYWPVGVRLRKDASSPQIYQEEGGAAWFCQWSSHQTCRPPVEAFCWKKYDHHPEAFHRRSSTNCSSNHTLNSSCGSAEPGLPLDGVCHPAEAQGHQLSQLDSMS